MKKVITITEDQLRYIYDSLNSSYNFEHQDSVILERIYNPPDFSVGIELISLVSDGGRFRGFSLSYQQYQDPHRKCNIYTLGFTNERYDDFVHIVSKVLSLPVYQRAIEGANEILLHNTIDLKIMTYKNSLDEHGNIVLKEEK